MSYTQYITKTAGKNGATGQALNHKLDARRSSPLKVIGKIGNNAYCLDVPDNMKIHSVVSVAQLEPLPRGQYAKPNGAVNNHRRQRVVTLAQLEAIASGYSFQQDPFSWSRRLEAFG
ncbi:hypothetical protein HBI56_091410 [Parastagonospora nodorum]|nr:hypothetical protein HBI95_042810 [Parastagonospora nodorum]KAH4299202.1 hypothetical protein HBI02_153850 [Parastagonospora nodorum]KAH4300949.1 hypothetical protein HBI01_102390 [Parastagonospora nodorum]KAH4325796.1 hypothetical protein HBI00_146060 [Parastagonospora nodorum]KAH4365827.1 hypothetical protein HBH94_155900 [Parastagonospora nodorum]